MSSPITPISVILPSSCDKSFSNAISWDISVDDWSKAAIDSGFRLNFESSIPHDNKIVKWDLLVFPKGRIHEPEPGKDVAVYLVMKDPKYTKLTMPKFRIETAYRIRKPNQTKPLDLHNRRSYQTFRSSKFLHTRSIWSRLKSSYVVGTVEERAQNGFIKFDFEIRTYSESKVKFRGSDSIVKQKFVRNFKDFYGEIGDVKIVCGGKEFPCHKLLLISQSPVFKAMFNQDSKENADSLITVEDCNPEAVQEFLFFLYHAMLRPEPFTSADLEIVLGLVHLASKYQVELLMESCLDLLLDIMDSNNVLKIKVVAEKYPELSQISKKIVSFMKKNVPEIVTTVDWNEFYANNPSLVTELLLSFHSVNK